ncbi:MAG: hypothetical protein IRY85_09605 [Micromonosporaceae bacterium]|nr:hypothetical protein [Micromonosporaceae bacterium]
MVGAWVRLIVNSAVTAAVVVAAQLGAGDALGLLQWDGPHDDQAWITLLTWVAFTFAAAVLAGALSGRAAFRRLRGRDGLGVRIVVSVVSGAGAAAVIGLAWLPARDLRPPINANPGLVVSITAGAGVLVGLVLALLALSIQPMAAGVLTTVGWVWLLGLGAAIAGLTSGEPNPAPRVGVPDAPSLIPPSAWTGPRIMIIAAIVLGLVVAAVARARGASRLSTAFSGFGGPALVGAAYLIAGPGENQGEAYVAALLGVAAGLAASAVVAIPGRSVDGDRPGAAAEARDASSDVLVSTRVPVPGGSPSGTSRPAWAEGSGAIARAYSGTSATSTIPVTSTIPTTSTIPATSTTPAETTTKGTGWDADTLAGTTHPSAGRSAERTERGGGLYRSTGSYSAEPTSTPPSRGTGVMGQPSRDPHESWVGELRATGRHAAE